MPCRQGFGFGSREIGRKEKGERREWGNWEVLSYLDQGKNKEKRKKV